MSIRDFFRRRQGNDGGSAPEEGGDLDAIREALEDEMLAEHLSLVHDRAVTPPPAVEIERDAEEARETPFDFRVRSVFDYHSVFHRKLWGKTSEMSRAERTTVADYLDVLANNIGYRGMYLGSSQLLEIAAHLREPGFESSLLVEPWMTPFKLRRRDVNDLYRHLCKEAARLANGSPRDMNRKYVGDEMDRLRQELELLDTGALAVLKGAVERVASEDGDPAAVSLYMNMDYVLACCGDRGAMSRLAGYMDHLVRTDPFLATRGENAPGVDDVRRVVGRSWMRLAAAVARSGPDPFTTARRWMPDIWLDLRYLDRSPLGQAERRGLVIPALSPEDDSLAFSRRAWRDDRYGERKHGSGPGGAAAISEDGVDEEVRAAAIRRAIDLLSGLGVDRLSPGGTDGQMDPDGSAVGSIIDVLSDIGASGFDGEENAARRREIGKTISASLGRRGSAGQDARLLSELVRRKTGPADAVSGTAVILDAIGPSETSRGEGRAEETYARLLQPLRLAVSAVDADTVYARLQSEFPWMKEANRLVALAAARSDRQKVKFFRIPPTLLVGPPGTGKTRWIRRVSEITGVPSHSISLSGVIHSKSVIGSERGWASARPSFMAYGFLETLAANPVFHVDEVDKCGANGNEPDVQESLLPVLEPETSRAYRDLYLLGCLDLGWSSFLLSANDMSRVSPVLLTRLDVVHVRRPDANEVKGIIDTMIAEACANEEFSPSELSSIGERVRAKASRIFRESGDLRDVRRFVEKEVSERLWHPPGPRLVTD